MSSPDDPSALARVTRIATFLEGKLWIDRVPRGSDPHKRLLVLLSELDAGRPSKEIPGRQTAAARNVRLIERLLPLLSNVELRGLVRSLLVNLRDRPRDPGVYFKASWLCDGVDDLPSIDVSSFREVTRPPLNLDCLHKPRDPAPRKSLQTCWTFCQGLQDSVGRSVSRLSRESMVILRARRY